MGVRTVNSVFILITWDDGMPKVQSSEDQHTAIEMLKDAKPYHQATYLFQVNPDGVWIEVRGW